MKRYLLLIIVLLLLSLVSYSFTSANLILIFSLSLLFLGNDRIASVSGFVGGLFLDLLGVKSFGLMTFSLCLVIFLILFVRRFIGKSKFSTIVLWVFAILLFDVVLSLPLISFPKEVVRLLLVNFIFGLMCHPTAIWINELYKGNLLRRN